MLREPLARRREYRLDDKALMRQLHDELEATGALRRRSWPSWAKFGFLLTAMLGAYAAIVVAPWWAAFAIMPVAALFTTAAAMMGHEAIHRAACASRFGNQIIATIAFQLIGGHGERFWRHKHNKNHHRNPNVLGADTDLTMWPLAQSQADYLASGRVVRWFNRNLQKLAFWPLTTVVVFQMRVDSFKFIVKEARAGRFDLALAVDTVFVLAHYVLWIVLPALLFGLLPTLLFYVCLWAPVGFMLAALFSVGHMGLVVVTDYRSNVHLQFATSRSIRMPRFLSWFAIGLDYQLEHHLFPRVSHLQLPIVARHVEAFAARERMPYHRVGFPAALADVTRFMGDAWTRPPISLSPPAVAAAPPPPPSLPEHRLAS